MKQKLLVIFIGCCLGVIVFVTYNFCAPMSVAGNKEYKEEYYYNDFVNSDEELVMKNEPLYDVLKEETVSKTSITSTPLIVTDPTHTAVLINRDYPLPADYVPTDMVMLSIPFDSTTYSEKKYLKREAAEALEKMFAKASEKGLSLIGVSGYRSYERQQAIYNHNLRSDGETLTNLYSAIPGCSEHQSGFAIDVSCKGIYCRLEEEFATTAEGIWVAKNAHKFGYILRYPEDKSEITGYAYEPWHIRYVGKKLAKHLYKNNLTLEEYYGYVPSSALTEEAHYGNAIDVEDSSHFIEQ